ncbi:MAG: ABC transporter permease [Acidimicrobiia bacterium]
MKARHIAAVNLIRFLRERGNIFFVFIFPLLLVLGIGVAFGGTGESPVAVSGAKSGPLAADLTRSLDELPQLVVVQASESASLEAVERGRAEAAVLIPADYDARLASGQAATVGFVAQPDAQLLRAPIEAAVRSQSVVLSSARFASTLGLAPFDVSLQTAERVAAAVPSIPVEVQAAGESEFAEFALLGRFDLGASSQLVLFVFLTSLTGASALIQTRQFGVTRRMLATPTPSGSIVAGEGAGRFVVALTQGLYIVVGTFLIFRVNWGDPLGTLAILVCFSLVGTGAAILMGSSLRNDQQAGALGVFLGLILAALGGSMVPIELFPPTLEKLAFLTPHAWANDAFAELVRRDGTIADILPQLGVLLVFAGALLGTATWRLRRAIVAV